jgi:DNA polymerase-4
MSQQRKIIHVDMDAFFASVEQRDNPTLKGKPVIVGGKPNSRGVVAACSYEARQFGIRSAMPCSKAYRLCPDAIFVPPRFEAYCEVSNQIRTIFWQYASEVEPLSLDEAYLDVSFTEAHKGSATLIAKAIKADILAATNLVASAGVSYNKFLAKMASDMDKPDGLYLIKPDEGEAFVAGLKIGQFHGVGPATEAKMHKLGIFTGADLKQWSLPQLTDKFGKSAHHYFNIARGIDNRPVKSTRIRKSLGKETTFAEDVLSVDSLLVTLANLTDVVFASLDKQQLQGRTLTVKVKYTNFQQVTRAFTADYQLTKQAIPALAKQLLAKTEAGKIPVRLVGLSISGFEHEAEKQQRVMQQTDLF